MRLPVADADIVVAQRITDFRQYRPVLAENPLNLRIFLREAVVGNIANMHDSAAAPGLDGQILQGTFKVPVILMGRVSGDMGVGNNLKGEQRYFSAC
ncbi:hypothetical protein D3C75_436860 [compost metagenome]